MTFWKKKHNPSDEALHQMSVELGVGIGELLYAAGEFWAGNANTCFVTTDHFGESDEKLMAAMGYYPFTVGGSDEVDMSRLSSTDDSKRKSRRKDKLPLLQK